MAIGVKVHVWGAMALFSRPELKTERYSYDVMTPSAARGILDSIYYHPGMRWIIDRIYVCKPIRFTSIRRNEVKSKIQASTMFGVMKGTKTDEGIITKKEIVQRASTILLDVDYVIEAHFEMTDKANATDNPGKFKDIIMRRLKRGECFCMPYFGCREFPAHFELCREEEVKTAYPNEVKDLGIMLYDMDFTDPKDIKPMFFRAKLQDGILDLRNCEVMQ